MKSVNLKGFEKYFVSENGDIYRNNKKLKDRLDRYGYLKVNLSQDGKRLTSTIHKLVALTYLENKECYQTTVNHKDGNKLNNHFLNLEWVTSLENQKHAYENDLYGNVYDVDVYDIKNNYVGNYKSIRKMALQLKIVNRKEIMLAIKNNWSYRGYSFKIKDNQ